MCLFLLFIVLYIYFLPIAPSLESVLNCYFCHVVEPATLNGFVWKFQFACLQYISAVQVVFGQWCVFNCLGSAPAHWNSNETMRLKFWFSVRECSHSCWLNNEKLAAHEQSLKVDVNTSKLKLNVIVSFSITVPKQDCPNTYGFHCMMRCMKSQLVLQYYILNYLKSPVPYE